MLKFVLAFLPLIFAVSTARFLQAEDDTIKCDVLNDKIDEILKTTNENILSLKKNVADLEGFESDVTFTLLGIGLFEIGKVRIENGQATGLNLLTRAGDLEVCSNTAGKLLDGDLMYEKLEATFDYSYKLLFWPVKGKVTYSIPTSNFNLYAANFGGDCSVLKFNFKNLKGVKATIQTSSWLGRLLRAITGNFEINQIPQSTLRAIEETSQTLVGQYFVNAWCSSA